MAEFRILGAVEVVDGGTLVDLGGARQRALLAILLVNRGEPVAADRLIEQLYGARPPRTALKSLQAHVSRLRKALGGNGRVRTEAGGYAIALTPDELDADRFSALIGDGRAAAAQGDAKAAARAFDDALALWRGRPFGDLAYEDFAQAEISRLDELHASCLEERLEIGLALGRHDELRPELERLVAEHPLRERLRGQLMLALYRSGRQAEALEAYQAARRALVDELGLEPSRALQELEQAILNQDPKLDLADADGKSPRTARPGRLAAGAFVGRSVELAELEAALADAVSGRGRFVLISGEAGIGKSRLADELAARAKATGVRVLWGRCWEAGGAPAYWPWVQALRAHVREADDVELRAQLGRGASELVDLLPEVSERLPDLEGAPGPTTDGARFRLFQATADFIRAIARDRPLLVVLDDVHAADAPSLLLLEFVAGELADAPILLIAAYRDPELEPGDPAAAALARLGRIGSRSLHLAGLRASDVATFVHLASSGDAPAALVQRIAAETEGNPLFVQEVVRLLAAEGRLGERVDPSSRLAIPETVKGVIGRRLERLSPDCREMLSVSSVVGREFELELVARVGERARDDVIALLDEAVVARLVADVAGGPGRLRFTHALIRDTLYDALPAGRRLDLHRRTVDAIEAIVGPDPAIRLSELAHHSFCALPLVDADVAVAYAQRAGAQASELLAHEEAARLYRSALDALASRVAPDKTLELALTLSLGDALARAGEMPDARDAFLRAAVLARATGDPDGLARAALGYGGRIVWTRAGGNQLVVSLLEEALAALGDEPTPYRARVLARLSGALRDEPDPTRRIALGEEAVTVARATGDPGALAYALDGLCAGLQASRDLDRRAAIASELEAVARHVHDREAEVDVHIAWSLLYFELGDLTRFRQSVVAMARLADELHQPAQLWIARATEALLALHDGRLAVAEKLSNEARAHGRVAQPRESEAAYAMQLLQIRLEQGRGAEARELLTAVAADLPARPLFRCGAARLACEVGHGADARSAFDELAANTFEVIPRDQEWLFSSAILAETCVMLGDRERAAVLYEELEPFAGTLATDVHEGTAGATARPLGLLAELLGRRDEAVSHLEAAIELNAATGGRIWLAHSQADLARVRLAAGERPAAESLIAASRAAADELGLVVLGDRLARMVI